MRTNEEKYFIIGYYYQFKKKTQLEQVLDKKL